MELKVIAEIHTAYKEKFGIPRQSGMVDMPAEIVFRPEYRDISAVRGLDGFSHIWVLWGFSKAVTDRFQPTVRPPRLGGNTKMGVFATRSPFRPNSIGLSSLTLHGIELCDNGPVLRVGGADMLDGTPIYDIKPYISFTDSHPDAVCGFTEGYTDYRLSVVIPLEFEELLPDDLKASVRELLACDPRPSYHSDPTRVYGLDVADYSVKFTVDGDTLTVKSIAHKDSISQSL